MLAGETDTGVDLLAPKAMESCRTVSHRLEKETTISRLHSHSIKQHVCSDIGHLVTRSTAWHSISVTLVRPQLESSRVSIHSLFSDCPRLCNFVGLSPFPLSTAQNSLIEAHNLKYVSGLLIRIWCLYLRRNKENINSRHQRGLRLPNELRVKPSAQDTTQYHTISNRINIAYHRCV